MAANCASQSLCEIVRAFDIDALAKYIVERHEAIVADGDMGLMLAYLVEGFGPANGEHYLDCRLRSAIRKFGLFLPMFPPPDKEMDFHRVWNEIHWPWEPGFADNHSGPRPEHKAEHDSEPRYTRSRLPRTLEQIVPVNRVAKRVAPPPSDNSEMR